jgi:hypothetical protein
MAVECPIPPEELLKVIKHLQAEVKIINGNLRDFANLLRHCRGTLQFRAANKQNGGGSLTGCSCKQTLKAR